MSRMNSRSISSALIGEEDVALWVRAALNAALPEMQKPILAAGEMQEKMLLKIVTVMLEGMEQQTKAVQECISRQGRMFVCMGICGVFMSDREMSLKQKILGILGGITFLGIVDAFVKFWNRIELSGFSAAPSITVARAI